MQAKPQLVAIVGGSGSGKTWLADRLQRKLGRGASRLSLDDFYRDRSHLGVSQRARVNFDHPRSIDWEFFTRVLREGAAGRRVRLPRYDLASHTRSAKLFSRKPTPLVLIDGLWLLRRPALRRLFGLRIFLDCDERLRFQRRLERDIGERGRTRKSVRQQFFQMTAPMHDRYVQPQIRWADVLLKGTVDRRQLAGLVARLKGLLTEALDSRSSERFEVRVESVAGKTVRPTRPPPRKQGKNRGRGRERRRGR